MVKSKWQRIMSSLLSVTIFLTMILSSMPVLGITMSQLSERDDGIVAQWTLGPAGYDDGVAHNDSRAIKLPNGNRITRETNHSAWGMFTALPVGSYFFKFAAKVKHGTANTRPNDRVFSIDLPGTGLSDSRAARPSALLRDFPDNEWVTVTVPFVIGNSLAKRNIEYAIWGADRGVIGEGGEAIIGRDIVVSTNNKPLHYKSHAKTDSPQGVIAAIPMAGGITNDIISQIQATGIMNDDRSRTFPTGGGGSYSFNAKLPQGQYYIKMTTKTSVIREGVLETQEIASFTSSAGLNAKLPMIVDYNVDEWKNVIIPFTVSSANSNQNVTYSLTDISNGVTDFTVSEYLIISDNDIPLPEPQQNWQDRYIPAFHLAEGISVQQQNFGGRRPAFDAVKGYLELPRTILSADRFVWDINMGLSNKQFANYGNLHKGKAYVKVEAKVPTLATSQQQNNKLFQLEMRAGNTVVSEMSVNYGEFEKEDTYQTIVREFNVTDEHFGGNRSWNAMFDGRFYPDVSDLHIKSITISATPDVKNSSVENEFEYEIGLKKYNINWPKGQPMPSFGTPADTLDLVRYRDSGLHYRIAMASMQGLVNRIQPRLISQEDWQDSDGNGYRNEELDYLPATLGLKYVFMPGNTPQLRVLNAINKYKEEIDGFVLYPTSLTSATNVATTLAGIYNSLPVTEDLLNILRAEPYNMDETRWPVNYSIPTNAWGTGSGSGAAGTERANAANWLFENFSPRRNGYQPGEPAFYDRSITMIAPTEHIGIRDLAVAINSPCLWLNRPITSNRPGADNVQSTASKRFYEQMRLHHNGGLDAVGLGFWENEEGGVKLATEYGVNTPVSDNFHNFTVYSGMSREIDPPTVPKKPDLVAGQNYVSVAVSDGDNIAYVQGAMRYNNRYPDTRGAGMWPINWTNSPALLDAAPQLLQYYYDSTNDNIMHITGPSGYGYTRAEGWESGPRTGTILGAPSPAKTWRVDLPDGRTGVEWVEGYAELTSRYFEISGINYPTIWGNVVGSSTEVMPRSAFDKFTDFNFAPGINGVYYLNRMSGSTPTGKYLTSAKSHTSGQLFATGGNGANANGNLRNYLSDFVQGGGQYNGVLNDLNTVANNTSGSNVSFQAFQVVNWNHEPLIRINNLQDEIKRGDNGDRIHFLRADHHFMLLNEYQGNPINNALQMETFASGYDKSFQPSKVVDGSFGRKHGWATSTKDANGKQWIAVDFGKRQPITRYVVKNAELAGYHADQNAKAWQLQVSNDAEEWTTIHTVTNNEKATYYGGDHTTNLSNDERYRYARLLIDDPGCSEGVARIQDIEIYGVNNWNRTNLNYTTYKNELEDAINKVPASGDDYTTNSWNNVTAAKTQAETINSGANTSNINTQAEIDTAAKTLETAISNLIRTSGDHNDINVTFTDGNGNIIEVKTTSYGGSVTPPQDPEKTGFDFAGWSVTNFTNIQNHMEVNATWTVKIINNVQFIDYDGTVLDTRQNVEYGSTLTPPTAPLRIGYYNRGWDSSLSYVVSDRFNVVQELITYNITYNNLGAGVTNSNPTSYTYGQDAVLQDPSPRTTWDFDGWYTSNTGTSSTSGGNKIENLNDLMSIISNTANLADGSRNPLTITITARWTGKVYDINYENLNGGVNPNPETYTFGAVMPLEPATRDDYEFLGWYNAETNGSIVTQISATTSGELTLYAYWKLMQDKDGLAAAIADAKSKNAADYSETSWGALQEALTEAETVNDNETAKQSEIDTAVTTLTTAISALTNDREALQEAIDDAESKIITDYSAASSLAMQTALLMAIEQDTETAKQSDIDTATAALITQINALTIDRTALQAAIAAAESKTETDYTAASWGVMQTALTAAKAQDTETAKQSEINTALLALSTAIDALTNDRTALKAAIADAESKTETDYTAASWGVMQTALTAAKAQDTETAKQSEIETAATALMTAIENLEDEVIATYNITYNANGGTGAPAPQTKTQGTNLTLSNTRPTRANHTFVGWSTNRNATTAQFAAGGTYTANNDAAFFAIWRINTYRVRFMDGNNTLKTPAARNVAHGSRIQRPKNPTKKGHKFVGWFTKRNGNTQFRFGTSGTQITKPTDIYARFVKNPSKPAKFTAKRSGTRKARLTWTAQSGVVMEIRYKRTGTSRWTTRTTRAGAKNWTSPNLTRKRTFQFQVRGVRTVNKVKVPGSWTSVKRVSIK